MAVAISRPQPMRQMHLYRTDDVSPLVEQDVLLLGATEDFCNPFHHFYDQIRMQTNARAYGSPLHEARTRTTALADWQFRLPFLVIRDWIDTMRERDEAPSQ